MRLWPSPDPSAWVIGAIGGAAAGLSVSLVRFWPRWSDRGGAGPKARRPRGWIVLMVAGGALAMIAPWLPGDPWGGIMLGAAAIGLLALGGAAVALKKDHPNRG